MKRISRFLLLSLTLLLPYSSLDSVACSMCKVTINGHTYLGNNEDSWRLGTRIWFENGKIGRLGSLYVGYNDLPQGGMNEAGLSFDGLTTYPKPFKTDPGKKEIVEPISFLKEIMQTCKTVEDVKRIAIQYNRQNIFNNGEYLFADKLGNYLVMEPDTLVSGNDDKYLIANFCPSITSEKQKQSFARYKRGETFLLNHKYDTSSNFCYALTDTMHECREKLGDGTMYSFIADLEQGDFALYFYHDFKHPIVFNLKEELAKGNHILQIPSLFPPNIEYQKLLNYKTPQNSFTILMFLWSSVLLFSFSALFYFTEFIRKIKVGTLQTTNNKTRLLLSAISILLSYYIYTLMKNQAIFYLPAPYQDYKFSMLTIAAYIPFIMLVLIIPLFIKNIILFKEPSWGIFSKSLFALNNLTYLTLIALFTYWGFYNIF